MKDKKFFRVVERAIKGDQRSFETLMQLRSRNILYIAKSIMGDKTSGEDVAQEAATLMQRSISSLRNPEAFNSWMYKIVYNACLDEKKKMSRTKEYKELNSQVEECFQEERDELLPEGFINNDHMREQLLSAIEQLPEKHRMCMLLYYYEDLDYTAIAEVMDLPKQNVANYLYQAKKRLRVQLAGSELDIRSKRTTTENAATDTANKNISINTTVSKNAGMVGVGAAITQALHADEQASITSAMVRNFVASVGAVGGIGTGAAVTTGTALNVGAFSVAAATMGRLRDIGIAGIIVPVACAATIAGGVYVGWVATVEQSSQATPQSAESVSQVEPSEENADEAIPEQDQQEEETDITDSEQVEKEAEVTEAQEDQQPSFPNEESWEEFVEEARLYAMDSTYERTAEGTYQYTVYIHDDAETQNLKATIKRTDESGNIAVAYNTIKNINSVPEGFEIIDAFYAWQ